VIRVYDEAGNVIETTSPQRQTVMPRKAVPESIPGFLKQAGPTQNSGRRFDAVASARSREIDDDYIASLLPDISSHQVRVDKIVGARSNWLFEISAYPVSVGTGTPESSA
jgi:hypothetical protein